MRMNNQVDTQESQWFAIRTNRDSKAQEVLAPLVDEIMMPKTKIKLQDGRKVERPLIPRVLFIKTSYDNALDLEKQGRQIDSLNLPFWVYRYPESDKIQSISEKSIRLLRLLSSEAGEECEVLPPDAFPLGARVRVTGGIFKGYEGYVKRIRKDRRVLVEISGLCLLLLPFIHPSLLQPTQQ